MHIVYVKSDILTNWINGPILLGTNVVHLSGVHCSKEVYGRPDDKQNHCRTGEEYECERRGLPLACG